jgi:exonuclease III
MNLSVVIWNMNHWPRSSKQRAEAWAYLRDGLAPDFALVQEAVPPSDVPGVVYSPLTSQNYVWGTAVVVFNPILRVTAIPRRPVATSLVVGELEDNQPGTSAAAIVTLPSGKEIVALSVYGAMEKTGTGKSSATTTVHRILSDLTPLLDSAREPRPMIFGGDLNCSTQFEDADRAAHEAVFARIGAFGLKDWFVASAGQRTHLTDCFCAQAGACAHQRTLRLKNSPDSRPWQTDYVFSHHIGNSTTSMEVINEPIAWGLSDHAPIVLRTDL